MDGLDKCFLDPIQFIQWLMICHAKRFRRGLSCFSLARYVGGNGFDFSVLV